MMSAFEQAWQILKRDAFWPNEWMPRVESEDYARDVLQRLGGEREQAIFGPQVSDHHARSTIRDTEGGSWIDEAKRLHEREEDAFDEASRESELSMNQAPFLTASEADRAARDWKRRSNRGRNRTHEEGERQLGFKPERFAESTPQTFDSTARGTEIKPLSLRGGPE